MTIHLSRILDNAPVRDAMVTVAAQRRRPPDHRRGRWQLHAADAGPHPSGGGVAVQLQVAFDGSREELKGTLQIGAAGVKTGGEEQRPAARVVGAQLRRVHRLSHAVVETAKGRADLSRLTALGRLKALERLHQELKALNAGAAAERKGEIDVQHVAETAARVAEAQPKTDVAQQPGIAVADAAAAPGAAHIGEDGSAHPRQPKRIPVREDALLDGEYSP